MSAVHLRISLPLLIAVGLFAAGCASPPEAEKKAADEAVSAAKSAGAAQYAPSGFAAMTAAATKAESEMSAKAYKEAKATYLTVKELADKAATSAASGKASMKAEVEKQLADLGQRWQDVQAKAQAAARKLKADRKQAWEADTKAVSEAIEAAKAALASDASAAKEKLAGLGTTLEKWEADLAAMAASMTKPEPKVKK